MRGLYFSADHPLSWFNSTFTKVAGAEECQAKCQGEAVTFRHSYENILRGIGRGRFLLSRTEHLDLYKDVSGCGIQGYFMEGRLVCDYFAQADLGVTLPVW